MHCSSFPYSGSSLKWWPLLRIMTTSSRLHQTCELSLEKRIWCSLAPDDLSCQKLQANIFKYPPNCFILSLLHCCKHLSSWIISKSFMRGTSLMTRIQTYFHSSLSSCSGHLCTMAPPKIIPEPVQNGENVFFASNELQIRQK